MHSVSTVFKVASSLEHRNRNLARSLSVQSQDRLPHTHLLLWYPTPAAAIEPVPITLPTQRVRTMLCSSGKLGEGRGSNWHDRKKEHFESVSTCFSPLDAMLATTVLNLHIIARRQDSPTLENYDLSSLSSQHFGPRVYCSTKSNFLVKSLSPVSRRLSQ